MNDITWCLILTAICWGCEPVWFKVHQPDSRWQSWWLHTERKCKSGLFGKAASHDFTVPPSHNCKFISIFAVHSLCLRFEKYWVCSSQVFFFPSCFFSKLLEKKLQLPFVFILWWKWASTVFLVCFEKILCFSYLLLILTGFYLCSSICVGKFKGEVLIWAKNSFTSSVFGKPSNACQVIRFSWLINATNLKKSNLILTLISSIFQPT